MAHPSKVAIALWKIAACGDAETATTTQLILDELIHLCAPQAQRADPLIAAPLAAGGQLEGVSWCQPLAQCDSPLACYQMVRKLAGFFSSQHAQSIALVRAFACRLPTLYSVPALAISVQYYYVV